MALINCPECNKETSDKAESCPHCGYPIENSFKLHHNNSETVKENEMNYRILKIILPILILISISCFIGVKFYNQKIDKTKVIIDKLYEFSVKIEQAKQKDDSRAVAIYEEGYRINFDSYEAIIRTLSDKQIEKIEGYINNNYINKINIFP